MKDFDNWNDLKKQTQTKFNSPYFYEREIWFISMGLNLGVEQDGKGKQYLRPVIILKKFSKDSFWGLPLTTSQKVGKYYYNFKDSKNNNQTVMISQFRLFSSKRLISKIGDISKNDFLNLKGKIKSLID